MSYAQKTKDSQPTGIDHTYSKPEQSQNQNKTDGKSIDATWLLSIIIQLIQILKAKDNEENQAKKIGSLIEKMTSTKVSIETIIPNLK